MAFVIVATLPFLVGVGMAISLATGKLKVNQDMFYLFFKILYTSKLAVVHSNNDISTKMKPIII